MFTIQFQILKFMNSFSPLQIDLFDVGELIPILGILLPVLIILLVSLSTISTKSPFFKLDLSVLLDKINCPLEGSEGSLKSLKYEELVL